MVKKKVPVACIYANILAVWTASIQNTARESDEVMRFDAFGKTKE